MSAYFEALEAHNAASEPKGTRPGESPQVSDENRVRRFHRARKVANDG